jgi:uncharacterized protein YprB with RNaseH-like and TPR domain
MLTTTTTISDETFYPSEDTCYFDIETTGLSRDIDHIFMISLLKAVDGSFALTQLLCDDVSQEDNCIRDFFMHIGNCDTLAHYSGTAFDIPFIKAKIATYSLPYSFNSFNSIDVARELKRFQPRLGCADMKQFTVEKAAGFERDDTIKPQFIMGLYAKYIGYRKLAGFDSEYEPMLETYRKQLLRHAHNDLVGLLRCHLLLHKLLMES